VLRGKSSLNSAIRRGTILQNVEAAALPRLIDATDAALSRMWGRYSTAELRELAQSLHTGRPTPVVRRLDEDLARLAGAFDGGEP